MLLHNSNLDELLSYGCWLACDDIRFVNTGLGFGAEKGHPVIKEIMEAYRTYEYPSGTNVQRDTLVLERVCPGWVKSNANQVIGDLLIIGRDGYGHYAKHLYTFSWADAETHRARMEKIYMFCAYDLLDCGPWYFVKRLFFIIFRSGKQ